MGKLVEVVGKVAEIDGGLGIRVLATTDWGSPADCGTLYSPPGTIFPIGAVANILSRLQDLREGC
jgi:hypothetical protein